MQRTIEILFIRVLIWLLLWPVRAVLFPFNVLLVCIYVPCEKANDLLTGWFWPTRDRLRIELHRLQDEQRWGAP